jgi:hypothetical protein
MIRKSLQVLIPTAALGLIVASQWQDIRRYLKIRKLSQGQGHPENVPVEGTAKYPHHPGDGEPDGTGDFDSASRGGPSRQP